MLVGRTVRSSGMRRVTAKLSPGCYCSCIFVRGTLIKNWLVFDSIARIYSDALKNQPPHDINWLSTSSMAINSVATGKWRHWCIHLQHNSLSKSFAPYNNTALITFAMPRKYKIFKCVPKRIMLKTPVNTTETAVAYPFKTASAYFNTGTSNLVFERRVVS